MNEKIFRLQPWTPRVRETAEDIIARIHTIAPDLEILFMGAAVLGLPGKNDIDLDILCDVADVRAYTDKLIPILGQPKEAKENLAAWEFEYDGFEVDCILSDPNLSHVPLQRKRFERLKADPVLLHEYKELKEACDGLPSSEYERRKIAFLEERVAPSNPNAY